MKYYSYRYLVIFGLTWILLCKVSESNGQNFGGIPPSQDWKIKKTAQVDVIYNRGLEHRADDIIQDINDIQSHSVLSLGSHSDHIPIILRNNNLTANGFVSYAPYRSEFYLHGSQDPNLIGYGDWPQLLTTHEYRHVLQFSNFRAGPLNVISKFAGQAAMGGTYHFLIPNWFTEGDAVYFESEVTQVGRGQLPAFDADLHAILQAGKNHSYAKFRNGSFKDIIPNHYVFGYQLVAHGYREYGEDFWSRILNNSHRLKYGLPPFAKAIRKNTGQTISQFSNDALAQYVNLHSEFRHITDKSSPLFDDDKNIRNEKIILTIDADRSILLQSSYDEINTVYLVTGVRKEKLFALGATNDAYIKNYGSQIFYLNQSPHPRWTNQTYSDIYQYDINSHKNIKITNHSRILSFDHHPATGQFAAVLGDERGENQLVLLDANGEKQDTLLQIPGAIMAYPSFNDSGDKIVFTVRREGRMSLQTYDLRSRELNSIIPPIDATIARPYHHKEGVLFSSSISGRDQIYYYRFSEKQIYSISQSPTGDYNPTYNREKDMIYFSRKTAYGQRLYSSAMNLETSANALFVSQKTENNHSFLNQQTKQRKLDLSNQAMVTESDYKPLKHMFKFHSLYLNPSLSTPKLSIISNDYLNTTEAEIFGQYYDSDGTYALGGQVTYGQSFTQFSLEAQHRLNRKLYIRYNNEILSLPKSETTLEGSIILPLNFSKRNYGEYLTTELTHSIVQEHFDPSSLELPSNVILEPSQFQKTNLSIQWQRSAMMAYRDIIPRWGWNTYHNYFRSWDDSQPYLYYNYTHIYLPGFFKNDGFKINLQSQWNSRLANNYLPFYIQSAILPDYDVTTFTRGGVLAANYIFPICYPEVSIPHIMYTKRLAGNLFGEYFIHNPNTKIWQYGADLLLTARYLNLFEFTIGLRGYYRHNTKQFNMNLVFLSDL
ncbi:TolB family protein [Membranihabitans marinus]|uniref:TolB family protein n=1 Tax=Membranihabitans marinus TaxID=1227546 RepID=UPI001F2C812E|nr:hypothetical protein [Membranihabitans marinus]